MNNADQLFYTLAGRINALQSLMTPLWGQWLKDGDGDPIERLGRIERAVFSEDPSAPDASEGEKLRDQVERDTIAKVFSEVRDWLSDHPEA